MVNWNEEKENLKKMILEKNLPYDEIGKIYGCTGSNVRRVAQRYGFYEPRRKINPKETFGKGTGKQTFCKNCGENISHKYGNIYCNVNCQTEHQQKEKYRKFLEDPSDLQRANYACKWLKPIILKEQNNKCDICEIEPVWNNQELIFILDHIDGNASHNTRQNLRLVCPNCDTQLPTFKSRNKNGSRYYYRYGKEKDNGE